MAKMTLTLDTEDGSLSVDVDGESVGNIAEIAIYNWGSQDEPRYSFSTTSYERVGDVSKMTRLMAKESPEARRAREAGERVVPSRTIAGFVEAPAMTRAQEQILAWHKANRG